MLSAAVTLHRHPPSPRLGSPEQLASQIRGRRSQQIQHFGRLSQHASPDYSRLSQSTTSCNLKRLMYPRVARPRTCLWSRVGWRGSGQEAGQPPEMDRQPEAKPVNPAERGTWLKATTEWAFSSLSASQADVSKRLVFLCRPCGTGLLPPHAKAMNAASAALCCVDDVNVRRSPLSSLVVREIAISRKRPVATSDLTTPEHRSKRVPA
jgi:hypothetical protein